MKQKWWSVCFPWLSFSLPVNLQPRIWSVNLMFPLSISLSTKTSNLKRGKRLVHAENDPYGLIVFWHRQAVSRKQRALTPSLIHSIGPNRSPIPLCQDRITCIVHLFIFAVISGKTNNGDLSFSLLQLVWQEPKLKPSDISNLKKDVYCCKDFKRELMTE